MKVGTEFVGVETIHNLGGGVQLFALSNRDLNALLEEYQKIQFPHSVVSFYGLGNKHYMILEVKGTIKRTKKNKE